MERPRVSTLLTAQLSHEDRKRAIENFEALQLLEKYSYEWVSAKNDLIEFIHEHTITSPELATEAARLRALVNTHTSLRDCILRLDAPSHTKAVIFAKFEKLSKMNSGDRDYATTKQWIEWAISIPHTRKCNRISQLHGASNAEVAEFLSSTMNKLNSELYGMAEVKQEIICTLHNYINSGVSSGAALAMVGPPGTGKTTIGQTLARALDMPFDKIDLGSIHDSATLMGHDDTYVGASPGLIVKILKRMKYSNGIVLFDEIDKLGISKEGRDVQYALLHITDFTQNKEFRDTYLSELKIDLSNIWFIYAMNDTTHVDRALLDRLPIINVPKYDNLEKISIVMDYLHPSLCKSLNINDITISRDAADYLVRNTPTDGGVRKIKDKLKEVVSRVSLYQRVGADSPLLWFKLPSDWCGEITVDVIREILGGSNAVDDDIGRRMMYT